MLNNLGNAYGDLGDHAKQRDVLERALAIEERAYGRDHPEVAITLGNLGNAYGTWATTRSSETCWSARSRSRSGRTAATTRLTNLGNVGQQADMLERSLAIKERAYGRDHAEVAIRWATSGTRRRLRARHAGARARDQRAGVRPRPPASGHHADEPRDAYGALGDHAKKLELQERALAIEERQYGRDHPELAPTLANIGVAHMQFGASDKAREYLERASAIFERAYGPDPDSQQCRRILASLS